jgi:5'-deoxynucleotidase YfbR-like HD superfamily hydrolase
MSLRPKNRNRPKLEALPKIENPRGAWDCTPPDEQLMGFKPWDHQEKDCYCQENNVEIAEGIWMKNPDNWTIDPKNFGESDFSDIKELEPEINSFYTQHPELGSGPLTDAWIQTYTGKKFYPHYPIPESICIEDIAHSLSNQCRFTGHTSIHYSVAQHSVLVSYLCNPENALQGLLHDGSEFALVDVASPIKKLPEMAGYRELEKKVQNAIYRRFELPETEPTDVKQADLLVLSIESKTFLAPLHPDWKMVISIPTLKIDPLSPQEAKKLFLDRFNELYPKI